MSHFEKAIETVLKHEGGYVNDPADPGGETKFGISWRQYPNVDIKNLTREDAIEIYRRDYWKPYRFDEIDSQNVATKVFDLAVNMGHNRAFKVLQQALQAVKEKVVIDGVLGPRTLAAVNRVPGNELLPAIRSEAACYYRLLVAKRPDLVKFINGWMNRAYG